MTAQSPAVPAARVTLRPQDQLFAVLYRELHRMARGELRRRGAWLSMSATTLLHEAFLSVSASKETAFPDRGRFISYAGRAMRGLIVDHARSRSAQKRGGDVEVQPLDMMIADSVARPEDVIRLGELIEELLHVDADLADLVDLRFFCGFSFEEIANMRACSERTVQRDWQKARLLLRGMLRGSDAAPVQVHAA